MTGHESSYSTVHWPFSGGQDRLDNRPELIDIAHLEDAFRTKANEYAAQSNFDYAKRVIDTGSQVVDLGIAVVGWGRRPMAAEQCYHYAEDRSRVPMRQWGEYFGDNDCAHIPEELLTFLNDTWYEFAGKNMIDVTLGYEHQRPASSVS